MPHGSGIKKAWVPAHKVQHLHCSFPVHLLMPILLAYP